MPKVSIVVPVYNGEKYIRQAIDSVLCQSMADWELVIVDDGSTDATPKIINEYSDPRIVKLRRENGGEARARNTGLDYVRGDYVAFLDADDQYLPDAMAERAKFLDEQQQYGVVVSDGHFCDANEKIIGRVSEIRAVRYEGDILAPLVLDPSVVSVPVGTMVRRSLIEQLNLRFDPEIGYGTDWDFWIQLARYTEFGYLDRLTFLYRVHDTNMTRGLGQQKISQGWMRNRMKVLAAPWFSELPPEIRFKFFAQLLTKLLIDQPTQQKAVLQSDQLRLLSVIAQAQLWRWVSMDYLTKHTCHDFALECLQRAVELCPSDKRSRFLLWVAVRGQPLMHSLLHMWQITRRVQRHMVAIRRQMPQPVPSQLYPVKD